MAQVSKDALRDGYQLAFENFALVEAGIIRQLNQVQQARQALIKNWELLDLGEVPEYEPEVRVRKVA